MKPVFLFDIRACVKSRIAPLAIILLLGMGLFAGHQFNFSAGEGIYLNAPFTIGFVLGLLSLSVIFIATIFAANLLFKEWDTRFDQILFTTSLHKDGFATGRFLSLFTLTVTSFLLIVVGFAVGQQLRSDVALLPGVHMQRYLYPFVVLGCINSLLVCSFLYLIAWRMRNKLLMVVGGLLLYVLYMVVLLFSNSPFMAQSMPQSMMAQQISALTDPFGLSAYFLESSSLSVVQRNTVVVPLSGYFLINRLIVLALSILCITLTIKRFSFTAASRRFRTAKWLADENPALHQQPYLITNTVHNALSALQAAWSFAKMDLIYTLKSIPFIATIIILLFDIGMEMYAAIEKGIRLPQQYASSGLMAVTISRNFHLIGLLLTVYFVNELFWRSNAARFSAIEYTTVGIRSKIWGHLLSNALLIVCFTTATILLGLAFQAGYGYTAIDPVAYAGVWVFNTMPLILLAGFLLLINQLVSQRYIALGLSLLLTLMIASPLSGKWISIPLLRFFSDFTGTYSDFNGYGPYLASFLLRLLFGGCVIGGLWFAYHTIKNKQLKFRSVMYFMLLLPTGYFAGKQFMQGYIPKDGHGQQEAAASYEKKYRKYASIPQPVITAVQTNIHLYPNRNGYTITGIYIIQNKTQASIDNILLNFDEDLRLVKARYSSSQESLDIHQHISTLQLKHPLQAGDSAHISFEISYEWQPVNGHQPFNAIIANGSFMRISRYYPQIGYQPQREITDSLVRQQFALGAPTETHKLEAPRQENHFIHLDMTISTTPDQMAIGTGELVKHWQENGRNYFRYTPGEPVPFRFAVASARYEVKRATYNGTDIYLYYHPQHAENAEQLLANAQQTLDYCTQHFGPYPFHSITFAEVPSFTRGFAATAYPAAVFMPEHMIFHANVHADKQQDVINELAGHELSHMWWGNNQIAPDDREGAAMLTETLAMYTEMMLYKKMHGKEKMLERIAVHQQIYDTEKGYSANRPLYRVTGEQTHISYSKGAVTMVRLSNLIGEAKVNEALRLFLDRYKYPGSAPVSIDLISSFLEVSDEKYHREIKAMFMEI
ncbi:MAG TPA: M1 family aminopeptidase [Chitinophaga sp.]|uniref:ABC transporter permease/M1 family aminopeptidase n=1 Tax=Chitinophaga sp. TaxID=1869181 RepID=UPI002BD3CD0D|nr:M1 family aminopeptidase [Chitinophaga sp.]HVI46840.1 M1 family aminopeptidase [Chitinophaga sp.]